MFVQMSEIMSDDYGNPYNLDVALGVTRDDGTYDIGSVSYTHLTLPTNREV